MMRLKPSFRKMPENTNKFDALPSFAAEKIKNEKILSLLGFAMRAGKLLCGTDKVCDEIRRHGCPEQSEARVRRRAGVVIIAKDASDNTKKRIVNACKYYNVSFIKSNISSEELAQRTGRSSAAAVCATFDHGFSAGIIKAAGDSTDNGLDRSERS